MPPDITVAPSVHFLPRLACSAAAIVMLGAAPAAAADGVLRGATTSRGGKVPFVGVVLTIADAGGRTVATARKEKGSVSREGKTIWVFSSGRWGEPPGGRYLFKSLKRL